MCRIDGGKDSSWYIKNDSDTTSFLPFHRTCNRQVNIGRSLRQNRPPRLCFIRRRLLLAVEGLLKTIARPFQHHDVAAVREPV